MTDRNILFVYAQSEEGESPEGGAEGDAEGGAESPAAPFPAFEACLKIRGLGEDTAGTLDALGSVFCAAIKGGGEGSSAEGLGAEKANGLSESIEKSDSAEVGLDENRQEGDADVVATPRPGDTQDSGSLESATDEDTSAADARSSSYQPALWSLEFAYSELERVLGALETAVSGLIFVVAAASQGAEREASALW